MKVHFAQTWPAIRRVVRDRGRHWIAAPYVSSGASTRLSLRKGDVLVTRFDDETIRAGQTDPREIVRYIKRGVEVHNEPYLHAKVYVSPKRAVICSANVSASSEYDLLEAGVEFVQRRAVGDARRLIQELRGAVIGLDYARRKVKIFRSEGRQRGRGKTTKPKLLTGHTLWIVRLFLRPRTSEAEAAARRARTKAVSRVTDAGAFRLEDFDFFTNFPGRIGDYVMQVVSDGRSVSVEAPAQLLVIEPYVYRRHNSVNVVVEVRKHVRTRSLAQMDAAVRPLTRRKFPRVARFRMVRNETLRRTILRQWPRVAETNVAR